MKSLTVNALAAAFLRANRKAYRSLALGILLAVFLSTAVPLCCQGMLLGLERDIEQLVGVTDCIVYDDPDVSDDALRGSGLFDALGHVYLAAGVKDSDVYLGWYDDPGAAIVMPSCLEGRMPEAPGELAAERSALEKLRLEAAPGDTVRLRLQPIDGTIVERSFTLVGILREQSGNLDPGGTFRSPIRTLHWPSMLLSPEESFDDGRLAIHRALTYAPLGNYTKVTEHHTTKNALTMAVSRSNGHVTTGDPRYFDRDIFIGQIGLMVILGCSLLLCTGIGISSAMESVLDARTEDIGMLRAVGATRRQIRHIFGRDAWLLSAVALLPGAALGTLAAWLLCRARPQEMVFAPSAWLFVPVLALSGACIFLGSALPLGRASRQTPLGVLRDTAMLRRAGRCKSRERFSPSRLIAGRQLRLHPWRQTGAALMVTATLLCAAMVGEIVYDAVREFARAKPIAFSLMPRYTEGAWQSPTGAFSDVKPLTRLSEQDLRQLRAMPEIKSADVSAQLFVDLLLEDGETPNYFTGFSQSRYEAYTGDEPEDKVVYSVMGALDAYYLLRSPTDPVPPAPAEDDYAAQSEWNAYQQYEQMHAAMDAQSLSGKPVRMALQVMDLRSVDFSQNEIEGKVDLDAVDAGREILVYAPDITVKNISVEGAPMYIASAGDYFPGEPIARFENDYFRAGMALPLTQLTDGGQPPAAEDYGGWLSLYAAVERHDAAPSVGAVLGGKAIRGYEVCLLTTEKGAAALGFDLTHVTNVEVSLTGDVDYPTELALVQRLDRLAMRGNMEVRNWLQYWREEVDSIRQVTALFGGMLLLFFSVAVAMQVGGVSRRIRADKRMIGTLRAVGADEGVLLGVYRLPMVVTAAAGTILAAALYLEFFLWLHGILGPETKLHPVTLLPVMALLGALCAACCLLGTRRRVRGVLRESIVENIREL